jgi:hypothetical protein
MQAGTDESAYIAYIDSDVDEYTIYETNSAFSFGLLNNVAWSTHPAETGDTVSIEVEGTDIRLGTAEGGADTERLTTTDATITGGDPGLSLFANADVANSQITSWLAGDIGAAPAATTLLGAGIF